MKEDKDVTANGEVGNQNAKELEKPKATLPLNRIYLTTDQAAEILHVTRKTVQNLIRDKQIKASQIRGPHGMWRIRQGDLTRYMEAQSNIKPVKEEQET